MPWRSHLAGVLRHPSEPRILLFRSDRVWRLPRAVVKEAVWVANAAAVVSAFERRLGTRPWLLRQLRFEEREEAQRLDAVFELELADPLWEAPPHGRWVESGDLDRLRVDDADEQLLRSYLDELGSGAIPEQRPPWARAGWATDARDWIQRETARLGHVLVGIEQVKHWSISSVLRVRTSGPTMYFKVPARLPLFVEEGIVTARLAERFPGYVPAPLAIEPERGWLLLPEFDELFPWTAPLETRADALRRFAGLQRRSAAEIDELLADGCLDRRLEVLEAQIHPLLHDPVATARFTADETIELRRLEPALEQLCRRLDALGPPATLVHGDLHMLNVARLNGELVYFDWTDACISHPFLDLISLQWEPDETSRAVLLNAYLEGWDGAAEPELLQEAVELAAVVRPLHHAVSYRTIVAGLEESAQGEHATDEFLRELLAQMRERARAAS